MQIPDERPLVLVADLRETSDALLPLGDALGARASGGWQRLLLPWPEPGQLELVYRELKPAPETLRLHRAVFETQERPLLAAGRFELDGESLWCDFEELQVTVFDHDGNDLAECTRSSKGELFNASWLLQEAPRFHLEPSGHDEWSLMDELRREPHLQCSAEWQRKRPPWRPWPWPRRRSAWSLYLDRERESEDEFGHLIQSWIQLDLQARSCRVEHSCILSRPREAPEP